ncbi:MAG: hypothetical protein OXE83_05870 [Gammaproteobacteria bacterium]|nr:hypothetical protein [Gammaproteobacteria bacterium]
MGFLVLALVLLTAAGVSEAYSDLLLQEDAQAFLVAKDPETLDVTNMIQDRKFVHFSV